jgi:hypothetical protein
MVYVDAYIPERRIQADHNTIDAYSCSAAVASVRGQLNTRPKDTSHTIEHLTHPNVTAAGPSLRLLLYSIFDALHSIIMSDYEDEPQFDENGAGQEDGAEPQSALEASIRRKGRNSYYYAHSKKLGRYVFYSVCVLVCRVCRLSACWTA